MIIKMVKLKVSFDKRWGKINENELMAANKTLWGKLAQEKCFYPKYLSTVNGI
jgi:hypothetical protein